MVFVPSRFPTSASSALGLTMVASFPIHRAVVNVSFSERVASSTMESKKAVLSKRTAVKEEEEEEVVEEE